MVEKFSDVVDSVMCAFVYAINVMFVCEMNI